MIFSCLVSNLYTLDEHLLCSTHLAFFFTSFCSYLACVCGSNTVLKKKLQLEFDYVNLISSFAEIFLRLYKKREIPAPAHAVHPHPVERRRCGTALPAAAQQRHVVAALRQATVDLVQVRLRTARLRILAIEPVDDEQAHRSEFVESSRQRIEHAVDEFRALL